MVLTGCTSKECSNPAGGQINNDDSANDVKVVDLTKVIFSHLPYIWGMASCESRRDNMPGKA